MKGGNRFPAKNNRFWSLPILLVASIRRKLVKTTYTEKHSVHTNSVSCNLYDSYRKMINLNLKHLNQILQPKIIDYFSMNSYHIHNIFNVFFYTMHLKRLFSARSLPHAIIQSMKSWDIWQSTILAFYVHCIWN